MLCSKRPPGLAEGDGVHGTPPSGIHGFILGMHMPAAGTTTGMALTCSAPVALTPPTGLSGLNMKDQVPADKCDWYQVRRWVQALWPFPSVFLSAGLDKYGWHRWRNWPLDHAALTTPTLPPLPTRRACHCSSCWTRLSRRRATSLRPSACPSWTATGEHEQAVVSGCSLSGLAAGTCPCTGATQCCCTYLAHPIAADPQGHGHSCDGQERGRRGEEGRHAHGHAQQVSTGRRAG